MVSEAPTVESSIERLERAWLRVIRQSELPAVDEHLRRASGVDLSRGSYVALARLHDGGPMGVSELASVAGVDISTMSRTLKHLLQQGLVERQPGSDRRCALIHTSVRGGELVAQRRQSGQRFLSEILHDWSEADRETMATLMTRLAGDFANYFNNLPEPAITH